MLHAALLQPTNSAPTSFQFGGESEIMCTYFVERILAITDLSEETDDKEVLPPFRRYTGLRVSECAVMLVPRNIAILTVLNHINRIRKLP